MSRSLYSTPAVPYSFVPVRDLTAIARAKANHAAWQAAFGKGGAAFLYCRETGRSRARSFHARMFAPELGITEDPATGSAGRRLPG